MILAASDTPPERRCGVAIMAGLFCLAFQFFFSYGSAFETHPLAPFLFMEATLAILIAYSAAAVFVKIATGRLMPLDLFFFIVPFAFVGLSAISAWLHFSQPLVLGISEERRAFTFLFWFAFDPVRRKYDLTLDDILKAVIICAGIYAAVGLALQIAVPHLLAARGIPDLDTRQLRISSPGDAFSITFLAGLARVLTGHRRLVNYTAIVIALIGLLLVAQTRQLTIAILITTFAAILVLRPLMLLAAAGIAVGGVGAALAAGVISDLAQIVDFLFPNIEEFAGESFGKNTRTNTLSIVSRLVLDNYLIGLGAVSLLYEGGLQRFYGRNFFINDVGIVGEFFRIGLFFPVFVAMFIAALVPVWRRISRPDDRFLCGILLVFYLLLVPTGGFIYRVGHVDAFLFVAMTAAAGRMRLAPAPQRSAPEWAGAPLPAPDAEPTQSVGLGHQ